MVINKKFSFTFLMGLVTIPLLTACGEETSSEPVEDFPNEDITWVVPFSAGSSSDIFARELISATEKQLDVNIVPENREGGGTNVGVSYVLNQEADGYTVGSNSATMASLIAAGDSDFNEEDIAWISQINADYKVLVVHANSGIETFEEFEEAAQENTLQVGGVATNSWSDIFHQQIVEQKELDTQYVPYDGGSDVITALLGENIDAAVATSSNVNESIENGDLNLLGVSSEERAEDYPDVPTFAELGFENMEDDLLWRGVFTHADVPEEHIDILNEAFEAAVQESEWQDYMENQRQLDVFLGPDEFTEVVEEEIAISEEALNE